MAPVCYILSFYKDVRIKRYFGATVNFDRRLKQHLSALRLGKHENLILQSLYTDGWRLCDRIDLFPMKTKDHALILEKAFILGSEGDPDVVNIGCDYNTFSRHPRQDEIKVGLIATLKFYRENSTHEEKSARTAGENNGMFGKTHSEKTRKVLSEKHILLNQVRDVHPSSGKTHSDRTKSRLSELASLRTGERNAFFGKKHSEETKKHWAEIKKGMLPPNLKPVSIEGVTFESASAAGRSLGLAVSVVTWRVKSNNPIFADWKWL